MSIYDKYTNNNLTLRAQEILANHIKKWNPLTQQFEELSGGSGQVDLPEYLRTNEINFQDRIILDDERLRMGNGTSIVFPNITLNGQLLASYEETMNQIDQNVRNVESDVTILKSDVNDLDQLITETNTKVRNIVGLTDALAFKLGTNKITMHSSGLRFMAAGGASDISITYPNVQIDKSNLYFSNSGLSTEFMDFNRTALVRKLNSYLNVTETSVDVGGVIDFKTNGSLKLSCALDSSAALTNKKMLLLDNTTKVVSYASIPAATVLPSYLFTDSISMNSPNNTNYVSMAAGTASTGSYFIASNTGIRPTSTKLIPDGVSFHPQGSPDAELDITIDYSDAKKIKSILSGHYSKKYMPGANDKWSILQTSSCLITTDFPQAMTNPGDSINPTTVSQPIFYPYECGKPFIFFFYGRPLTKKNSGNSTTVYFLLNDVSDVILGNQAVVECKYITAESGNDINASAITSVNGKIVNISIDAPVSTLKKALEVKITTSNTNEMQLYGQLRVVIEDLSNLETIDYTTW